MPATEEEIIEQPEDNLLGMSDEEVLNMAIPEDAPEASNDAEEVAEPEETVDEEASAETIEESEDKDSSGDVQDTSSEENKQSQETDEVIAKTEETNPKEDTSGLDYKAEYEKLIAPFRANGKDIQVSNVKDAITLMQQGANYNKKMAGLKPNLKLMKMLENNELLDEEKLSYLIDLNKKNPEAVQKFIKDSGIDPLDIDTEAKTEYKPGTYTVDDTEVELDAVLDEIRDTQSFNETIDVISNKWDASSKQVLLKQPDIISVINEHVGNGIYKQITGVVENERMLGRLQGLSDLEAYKQVGDAIQSAGGFANQQPTKQEIEQPTNTPNKIQDDPKLKDRKRAASSTKSKANKKVDSNFNPLNMSDEEFEKSINSHYM